MADELLKQYMKEVGAANATPANFEAWKKEREPRELGIWESGCPEWVIAYDEKDADEILCEHYGVDHDYDYDEDWTKLDSKKIFRFNLNPVESIYYTDFPQEFIDYLKEYKCPDNCKVILEATVEDWIKSHGRGFFATTEC